MSTWPNYDPEEEHQQLLTYRDIDTQAVWILTQRDETVCDACGPLDGYVLSVEEAIAEHFLPYKYCECEQCHCAYMPADDDAEITPIRDIYAAEEERRAGRAKSAR